MLLQIRHRKKLPAVSWGLIPTLVRFTEGSFYIFVGERTMEESEILSKKFNSKDSDS